MMKRLSRCCIYLLSILMVTACSDVAISPSNMPSALDPHGTNAARIAELWWVMLAFGTAILLLVTVLLFAAILRRRRGDRETAPNSSGGDTGRNWPIFGGIVTPLIILAIVFGYTIYTLAKTESPQGSPAVKVKVIGRRWWWEVKYPKEGITTANEIHLPVGKQVQIELQTADVIHSFWVPELSGKMDAIPLRKNVLTIDANKIGVYRGQCAEFCGLQHAHMGFVVVVQSQEDFDKWLSAQQQPAAEPADEAAKQGQQVFMDAGCVFCHTVKGLDDKEIDRSSVDLGPDLTHLASRLTIAGASLEKNQGNLAGWIVDAQHVKPGSLMPNMYIKSQDLQTLLVYLDTLR